MKEQLKKMFTKDEIAFYLERLCAKEENIKFLKKLIKLSSSKIFENIETTNP